MPQGVIAVGILTGVALFFGLVLAVSYRLLKVEEDPRLATVEEMLPASNCGACGEPGCRAFAEKLVAGKRTPSGCTVNSPEGIIAIAELLGVDAGESEKRVARLHCAGGKSQATQIAAYEGFESCAAAAVVAGGGKGCAWGCLGLADCERACTFDAISMNDDRLPVVDPVGCTACGDCVDGCPRDLFEILPLAAPLLVQCNIPLAGEAAKEFCRVACDACGLCALDAADGLITMKDNLPVIDIDSDALASPDAVRRCATGSIQWLGDESGQFVEASWKDTRVTG
jgi:Na+-translocating ferredoxin:NAD+ oxidoreductase RNF subunit RnfB